MSREPQLQSYMEDNMTVLEDVYNLIPWKDRAIIEDILIDALREAGYKPTDLAWNVVVDFYDERESE